MDRDPSAEIPALPFDDVVMPAPGDVIAGKYRIEAVLGRGGMSVVYRAIHLALEQRVAVKVLSASALALPGYIARLKREARAVSRVRSDHVVRIHDIGELPGGVPFLVMEYLCGVDLALLLARRGPLAVSLAVECILQTCEALAEVHAAGIVHRDLKPANLFLSETVDGSPCLKVLDFGISRSLRRAALGAGSPVTDPGTVMGTPGYMAPEQMESSEIVDARSDIWALGAILFELLVGRPPFTGDSVPQVFMKIARSRPPRPSRYRPDVPPEVDAAVVRCLAMDPARRYPTVAELAWALSATGSQAARASAERTTRVLSKRASELALPASAVSPAVAVQSLGSVVASRAAPRMGRAVVGGVAALALGIALSWGGLEVGRSVSRHTLAVDMPDSEGQLAAGEGGEESDASAPGGLPPARVTGAGAAQVLVNAGGPTCGSTPRRAVLDWPACAGDAARSP